MKRIKNDALDKATDIHGHTAEEARALFGAACAPCPLHMRDRIWYVRVLTTTNSKGRKVAPFPVYVALDERSKLVSNGTLKTTLLLAASHHLDL